MALERDVHENILKPPYDRVNATNISPTLALTHFMLGKQSISGGVKFSCVKIVNVRYRVLAKNTARSTRLYQAHAGVHMLRPETFPL